MTTAFESMADEIVRRFPSIQDSTPSLSLSIKWEKNILVLLGTGPMLRVAWQRRYTNTLAESKLEASLWRCHPPFPGIRYYENPCAFATKTLLPDVLPSEEACWVVQGDQDRGPLLPEMAAEFALNWWLKEAIKEQMASLKEP